MTNHNPIDDNNAAIESVFSRPIKVEKIKSTGLRENISASQEECKALAEQLKINSLETLSMRCVLMPWKKGGVEIKGEVKATIEEICVVSLEPFTSEVSEDVNRFFERQADDKTPSPLLDLEDADDDIPDILEGGLIDIAEIAAETLALSLSPYPRKPGAVFQDHVESDPEQNEGPTRQNPFDVLKKFKKH